MNADELAAVILEVVGRATLPLRQRMDDLDAETASIVAVRERLAALEARTPAVEALGAVRERLAVLETRAPVPGPAGRDGEDGRDGFGFEDLAVAVEGHTLTVSFTRDGQARAFPIDVPWLLYRGVWGEATEYTPGDVVTHDGSAWVCRATTTAKPGAGGDAWTLAVKRGQR